MSVSPLADHTDTVPRKMIAAAIAKTLNVITWKTKDGQPPPLAQLVLIDQTIGHDIK